MINVNDSFRKEPDAGKPQVRILRGAYDRKGCVYSTHKYLCISSFKMIIDLIKSGYRISFVYEVLAKSDPELGIFTLKGESIVREFNVSYLKHADVREKMEWFL